MDYNSTKDELLKEIDRLNSRIAELEQVDEERKTALNEAKESKEKLIEAIKSKDKFFNILAHDLKNPIHGFMDLARIISGNLVNFTLAELQENTKMLFESSNGLYKLLNNLLDWSRNQTNMIEFNPGIIDLSELVFNNIYIHKNNANKKEIELINLMNDETFVFADKNMINTVIRNIISNAIKFTDRKGKITVSSKDIGNYIELSISDTGIGLSEEDINNLFRIDVSKSTIGTSNEKGTGLGLILSKEFIEKNKGKIWAESKLCEGSVFKFTLPINQ